MSKLTKQQRRSRRKRRKDKKRREKRLSSKKTRQKAEPWVPVKMKMFEFPNPFPSNVPQEKRLEIIRSIGANAKREFDLKYPKIEEWFKKYDPLYLLSFCLTYFASTPEGIDPEATGEMDFFPFYIEIMQAFALYQERNYSPNPLFGDASVLNKEIKEIGELMSVRLIDIPKDLKTDEEILAYKLRTEMMMQTTAVRNWAYFHQMKRVSLALASKIDSDFKKSFGIGSSDLMKLLFKLSEERNDLLNDHLDRVRSFINKPDYKEIMEAYNQAFPSNKRIEANEMEELWNKAGKNKKHLTEMLICHADLKLENIYSFTVDHALSLLDGNITKETLKNILKKLSYNFGGLKDFNKEHIILSNPVHSKPFIKIDEEKFYSAIWVILPHLTLDLLEDFVWEDEDLREKYSDIRSKYLEDEIVKLFKSNFPNGTVSRGSLWKSGILGREYENDLTLTIDTFAIVVEAKSQKLSDPAKRGAPKRLFETLKELIEEPSEQALRFIDYLQKNKKVHAFKNKHGETNTIDSTKIKYYVPLGVTFSHLGMIGSNLKKLIEAKVTDKPLEKLAPSINFTDLEGVFELLPLEAEKIHYLARRREFEAHVEYDGDELDLLALYLENGFNIGVAEYDKKHVFFLGIKSKELDPYFIGINEGRKIAKPEFAMTQWWKDLLTTISMRKFDGWIETSFVLLNSTKEDQEKFEAGLKELMGRIKSGKVEKPHNWVAFITGPERRRYAIIGYPYTTSDKELRDTIMSEAIDGSEKEHKDIRGIVVIGIDMNHANYPYSVFARRLSTNLFDTLTL